MRQKELWGLKAICAYMGWRDRRAPLWALEREGFPVFRCRRNGHARPVWHTNSQLIRAWMTSKGRINQATVLWRELLEREQEKKK